MNELVTGKKCTVVNADEALSSAGPIGRPCSEDAIAEFRHCAGAQFDSELVEKFIKVIEEADAG